MTEDEKKILTIFESVIPKLDEKQKAYLLGMGEGLSMKIENAKAS